MALPASLTQLLDTRPDAIPAKARKQIAWEAEVLERAPVIISAYRTGALLEGKFEVKSYTANWWRKELRKIVPA